MCSSYDDLIVKVPVEVFRGRVLPFLGMKDMIRLCVVKTMGESLIYKEIDVYIRDALSRSDEDLLLTSKSAVSWFQRLGIHLQNLHLSCGVTDNFLDDCKWITNARALSLNCCTRLTSNRTAKFLLGCVQLERLDLTLCAVDYGLINTICALTNLTELSLAQVKSVSPTDICNILKKCTKLRSLSLHGCAQLTTIGITITAAECSALEALDLSDIPHTGSSAINNMCVYATNLKQLNLSHCRSINPDAMARLARCSRLEKLDLSNLSFGGIGAMCVHGLSVSCKNLTEFKVNGHKRITSQSIALLAFECRKLETLELCETNVTDAALFGIADYLPNLKRLSLNSTQVTDAGIVAIAMRCSLLTSLLVAKCSALTDTSVVSVAQHCTRLQELSISNCGAVTDTALVELSYHCSALQVLDVSFCALLTDTGISVIARGCRDLRWLAMHNCPQIADVSIVEVYVHTRYNSCFINKSIVVYWFYALQTQLECEQEFMLFLAHTTIRTGMHRRKVQSQIFYNYIYSHVYKNSEKLAGIAAHPRISSVLIVVAVSLKVAHIGAYSISKHFRAFSMSLGTT